MTRHKHTHTGLVTPSPLDRWIDATLRLFAMLVSNVAATLQMIRRRKPVIGTLAMPPALPEETHDTFKEPTAAKQRSHTSPSPSVSLTTSAIHLPLLRMGRQTRLRGIASTAVGGGGGSPRLRGETEGEATRANPDAPNKNAAA